MTGELLPIVKKAAPKELTSAIGNTLADAWHGIIGDRISAFRMSNAARLNKKLAERFEEQGIRPVWERVPERYAIAWFSSATEEDDDDLQDLFADLIANAALGNADAVLRRNVELVSQLSPQAAKFLQQLSAGFRGKIEEAETTGIWLAEYPTFENRLLSENGEFDRQSFEDLMRLQVLEMERDTSLDSSKLQRWLKGQIGQDGGGLYTTYPVEDALYASDEVFITLTGMSLIRALFPVTATP